MAGSAEYYDRILSGLAMPPTPIANAIPVIAKLGYRETNDEYDWLPTRRAYRRYLAYLRLTRSGMEPLSIRDFGFALRLAFPEAVPCTRRRARDGKSLKGWAGLTGPGAERSTDPDQWRHRRPKYVDDG